MCDLKAYIVIFIYYLVQVNAVYAGKLSIVIDDIGYYPHEGNAVLQMTEKVSIAVLPNAPHAHLMATRAHSEHREVLIHMPMSSFSK